MANLIPYRYRNLANRPFSILTDDFFRPFFQDPERAPGFRVDVRDMGEQYLLEADMPGISKEQLRIEVDNGVLTIAAQVNDSKREEKADYIYNERRAGSFQRSFTLHEIQEDAISAEYKDGVLSLTIPKQVEKAGAVRRIELK
jgi:HSP20 family protein